MQKLAIEELPKRGWGRVAKVEEALKLRGRVAIVVNGRWRATLIGIRRVSNVKERLEESCFSLVGGGGKLI